MLMINKGKFNIQVAKDNVDSTVATVFEGDVIGCVNLMMGENIRKSGIVSIEEEEVVFMSLKGLDSLERHNKKLAAQFYYNIVCLFSDKLENTLNELYG